GQAYCDIYNRNPEGKENDEVLYNALVCYHEGKSIGAAIISFNLLQRYYPKSKLMPRAVGRIGKAYGDVAFYDKAAEKLEEYSTKYAGEADAFSSMSDAVFFRKGIGDDAKAISDTKFFMDTFSRKKPAEAANAMFSMTSIYEKQGDKGGADKKVIAYAKIGLNLWEQSCKVKQVDGSCVSIVRERAISTQKQKRKKGASEQPTQCGPESKIKLTVIKRDDRKMREAIAAFDAAEREFEKVDGKTGGDE